MKSVRLKTLGSQRGVALIELALVLPLIVFLTFITLEFSKAISEYKVITNQVRAAARFLMTRSPGAANEQAKCIVRYGSSEVIVASGSTTCSNSANPILPGLSETLCPNPNCVIITDSRTSPSTHLSQTVTGPSGSRTTVNLVTVTVQGYRYKLFTGINIGSYFPVLNGVGSIRFEPISITMRQVSG